MTVTNEPGTNEPGTNVSPADYRRITVTPIAGALGAEIGGVDLRDLDDETVAEIRARVARAISSCSSATRSSTATRSSRSPGGSVSRSSTRSCPGFDDHPEIIAVKKLPTRPSTSAASGTPTPSYLDQPPMGTMLLAREIPPTGGDTMFANQYAAYERSVTGDAGDARAAPRRQQLGARRREQDPRGPHP